MRLEEARGCGALRWQLPADYFTGHTLSLRAFTVTKLKRHKSEAVTCKAQREEGRLRHRPRPPRAVQHMKLAAWTMALACAPAAALNVPLAVYSGRVLGVRARVTPISDREARLVLSGHGVGGCVQGRAFIGPADA